MNARSTSPAEMVEYLTIKHRMRDEDIGSAVGCSFMSVRNWRAGNNPTPAFRRELTKLYELKKKQERKAA